MKKLAVLLLTLMAALAAVAQTATLSVGAPLSPAGRSMAQANRLIEKNPSNFEAYNALALALSRRARETSDVIYYAQAEETLKKSFEISPGNFDGERIHVWLLLGKHEFAAAREEARKLNKKMPDDVMVYGFLTDANIELGNKRVDVQLDNDTVSVNGDQVTLSSPPAIAHNTLWVPLELFQDVLGCNVSYNYYTEAEFWSTWNKATYDAVKAITDPDNRFRDLFTKTCRAAMGLS